MAIKTLVIVPARSGSKGIPDKNIKLLGGKPLLAWTGETLHAAKLEDCLSILSTDDNRYAEVGRAAGLQVPFLRPAELATDSTTTIAVIEHALQWFEQSYRYLPEQVMILQPTSPFRPLGLLAQAMSMLQMHPVGSVISCKEIHRDLTGLFRLDSGFLKPLSTNQANTRRQDIAPLLTPNGALYLCKTQVILNNKSIYADHTVPLVMDALNSLDIDTATDWAMAEAFVQGRLV